MCRGLAVGFDIETKTFICKGLSHHTETLEKLEDKCIKLEIIQDNKQKRGFRVELDDNASYKYHEEWKKYITLAGNIKKHFSELINKWVDDNEMQILRWLMFLPNYGKFEGDYDASYQEVEGYYNASYQNVKGDYDANSQNIEGDYDAAHQNVKGDYNASFQKVKGDYYARAQNVEGDYEADFQKVKGNYDANAQEVEGDYYAAFQKVKGNYDASCQEVKGHYDASYQNVEGDYFANYQKVKGNYFINWIKLNNPEVDRFIEELTEEYKGRLTLVDLARLAMQNK